jgi:hypothetical protein
MERLREEKRREDEGEAMMKGGRGKRTDGRGGWHAEERKEEEIRKREERRRERGREEKRRGKVEGREEEGEGKRKEEEREGRGQRH